MALILEVLRGGRGKVHARLRVDVAPLTIGRALDNALILDDPHVDPHHARLERAEDGTPVLLDLGSVNALGTAAGRATRLAVGHDTTVTLGRTVLRFRDAEAPIPPALPLAPSGSEAPACFDRPRVQAAAVLGAAAYAGLASWLADTGRDAASSAVAAVIVAAVAALLWAGAWALATRATRRQFRFLPHMAIIAVAGSLLGVLLQLLSWTQFLWPASKAPSVIVGFLNLLVLGAAVAWHLREASTLPAWRRWRAGAVTSGILLALATLFSLVGKEEFSSVAVYRGEIKMVAPALVPTDDVASFTAAIGTLRTEVDSLLAGVE